MEHPIRRRICVRPWAVLALAGALAAAAPAAGASAGDVEGPARTEIAFPALAEVGEDPGDPFVSLVGALPLSRPSGHPIGPIAFLGVVEDPSWGGVARHGLRPLWLNRKALEARVANELANRFALSEAWDDEIEPHARALRAFRAKPEVALTLNRALGVGAALVVHAEVKPGWPGDVVLRADLHGGRTERGAFEATSEVWLPDGLGAFGRWNFGALSGYTLLLLLLARPLLRGSGRLSVHVPLQQRAEHGEAKADWRSVHGAATSVHLRPGDRRAAARTPKDDPRFNRVMVGAVTEFDRVPPGIYSVELRRVLHDPESGDVTSIQTEEKTVAVRRRKTLRVRFEQAEDFGGAAEHRRTSGDSEAAMRAYERAGDLRKAVACAFQTGDRRRGIELLERHDACFEAACVALQLDDSERAIALLQRVPMRDPHYGEACVALTQLFAGRGEPELAMQKLDEAVGELGTDDHLELREQIANLLENRGQLEAALEAYETIRKCDNHYPGVADRIEELRAAIREARKRAAP